MSLSATLERGVKASWEVYLSVRLSIPWNCTIRQLIAAAGREKREGSVRRVSVFLMDLKEGESEGRGLNGEKGGCEWGIGVE